MKSALRLGAASVGSLQFDLGVLKAREVELEREHFLLGQQLASVRLNVATYQAELDLRYKNQQIEMVLPRAS